MAGTWLCVCALLSAAFFTSTLASDNSIEQLVGQPVEVSLDDERLQPAAEFLETATSHFHNEKVTIKNAKVQVVGGLRYYLTLKVERTTGFEICEFILYSRPWYNEMSVESNDCDILEIKSTFLVN
ncbi:cystatin-like [Cetorhinus maximus]